MTGWTTLLFVCAFGCGISWRIAWARTHDVGTAVGLGVLGLLLPIIGVVAACLSPMQGGLREASDGESCCSGSRQRPQA